MNTTNTQITTVTAANPQLPVYNQDRVELIKRTVAQGATNDELALFIEQCKRTGLDPITRQIYFIKDKSGKVQIQTSIDGFRLVAERSGQYEGQTAPMWCGTDGVWKDVWLAKFPPAACKVGVYKKGFREALTAVALFDEYAQRNFKGELSFMWQKMPALMISKVAESLALRKAFANDLSGLYTQEEMAQANQTTETYQAASTEPTTLTHVATVTARVAPEQPWLDDGAPAPTDGPYRFKQGKHKGRTMEEVGEQVVRGWFEYWQKQKAEGKHLSGLLLQDFERADEYLAYCEGEHPVQDATDNNEDVPF